MKKILLAILSTALIFTSCQMAKDAAAPDLPDGDISLSSYSKAFDSTGGTVDVRVTSSGESNAWILEGTSPWVHPSPLSGVSRDVVTFTVDPNETDDELQAVFTFRLQHGNAEAQFTITIADKEAPAAE